MYNLPEDIKDMHSYPKKGTSLYWFVFGFMILVGVISISVYLINSTQVADHAISEKLISVSPMLVQVQLLPGETKEVRINVTNPGHTEKSITLKTTRMSSWVSIKGGSAVIGPNETKEIILVFKPTQNSVGFAEIMTFTQYEGTFAIVADLFEVKEYSLSSPEKLIELYQGGAHSIPLVIQNYEDEPETFNLSITNLNESWTNMASITPVEVPADSNVQKDLLLTIPQTARVGTYIFYVSASHPGNNKTVSFELNIKDSYVVLLSSTPSFEVLPGGKGTVTISSSGTGSLYNLTYSLSPSLQGKVLVSGGASSLVPGSSSAFTISGISPGSGAITFYGFEATGERIEKTVGVSVG